MKSKQVNKIIKRTGALLLLLTQVTLGQTANYNPLHSGLKSTYSSVIEELFLIDQDDQVGRNQADKLGNKYGWASREYMDFNQIEGLDQLNKSRSNYSEVWLAWC